MQSQTRRLEAARSRYGLTIKRHYELLALLTSRPEGMILDRPAVEAYRRLVDMALTDGRIQIQEEKQLAEARARGGITPGEHYAVIAEVLQTTAHPESPMYERGNNRADILWSSARHARIAQWKRAREEEEAEQKPIDTAAVLTAPLKLLVTQIMKEVRIPRGRADSLAAAITEEKEDDFVKQLTESTDKRHSALVSVAPVLCRMRGIV